MRTLVGAADFEPTLPHGLLVPSGTTTSATAYSFIVTTQPQAPAHSVTVEDLKALFDKFLPPPSAPREPEAYRTTAFVDRHREIEP